MRSKVSSSADSVLIEEYLEIPDLSSEAIIGDPDISKSLLKKVNQRLKQDDRFTQVTLNQRLSNLRKSGKLPRKFREFNGRDLKKKKPR